MNGKEIRFIDLFGGIGGFRIGLEQSSEKYKCVWYCDKDKYAVKTYNKNFNENYKPTDITTVEPETIPDFDMLCAGFPCQSFSIAGKRKGFQDIRGTMFYEILRVAQAKRPRLLFLENVKGLLSADDGRCFVTIITSLLQLGYSIEWQVLNSKNFGVPQNRERVFIIGHLGDGCGQEIFPIGECIETYTENNKSERRNRMETSLALRGGARQRYDGETLIADFCYDERLRLRNNVSPCLFDQAKGGGLSNDLFVVQRFPLKYLNRNQKNIEGDYSYTIDSAHTGGIIIHSLQPRSPDRPSLKYSSGGSGHLKRKDGYTYCHDGGNCQAVEYIKGIRRLTPIECERLQGFPDGWTNGVSDTQRYKQLGNAVTMNVIQAIGERILDKCV